MEYSLGKAYQLHENDITLQLIFPLSLIHSAAYVLTNLYSIAVRSFLADADTFFYVALLELILVVSCLRISLLLITSVVQYGCMPLASLCILIRAAVRLLLLPATLRVVT